MPTNWKSALVGPQTPLEQAIATIDQSSLQIAIVVDADQRLLGTLTDGDVRRAMLRHVPLDVPVSQVMGTSPKTAQSDWSKELILAVMKSIQVNHLPVVDADGRIVGLEMLRDLVQVPALTSAVFLMAGGFGTRLYPLTKEVPKPLLKVGDKAILERILESCVKAGFRRFFMSTHYLPELIQAHFGDGSNWGVSIRYVHEEAPLGTGGALGLLPHEEINEPLLVMNGDLITTVNLRGLLDFHKEHDAMATMCVRAYEQQVPFGVIQSEGAFVRSMIEKPVNRFFVNAGIYILSPALVRRVPRGVRIDMPTLLEQAIAKQERVASFPLHESWLDIGRMDDFEKAQTQFSSPAP